MTITVWPVDAVSGAPEYSGRMARQSSLAPLLAGATAARPLGARSGVRPGTPASTVTATSTTWTVQPHAGILDLEAAAEAGPYGYSIDAAVTGTVTSANATNPRIDIVFVTLSDPAEADGSTTPGVTVAYLAGTPAATPTAPTTPDRSMVLAQINVPQSSGGAPTVTWTAPYAAAAGSPIWVRSQDVADALVTSMSPTAESPLVVRHVGADNALEGTIAVHDGTSWRSLAPAAPASARALSVKRTSSGAFASGVWVTILTGTLSDAPAGLYLISWTLNVVSSSNAIAFLRGTANGTNLTSDLPFNAVANSNMTATVLEHYAHTGGSLAVALSVQVSAGTGTAPTGSRFTATWAGPV